MHSKMIIVGILEESKKRNTFKSLKEILIQGNYKINYENEKQSISILSQNEKNIMILDIEPEMMDSILGIGFDFNILIHTFLRKSTYEKGNLNQILEKAKNIIINSDEEKWTSLLECSKESIVVTYGFNNKSTINPSSYNINYLIETNICFQREILTISGRKVEPFEIGVKINSMDKKDLYSSIAALACGLILEIDHMLLKDSIEFQMDIME